MDIRQLRYFLAVAEGGSFSRGAELVHIAQPALSAQVGRLEDELKVKLFDRTSKGVKLTQAGMLLVQHARELFRSIEHMKRSVLLAADELHGEVNLGLPPTVALAVSIPLVVDVRKQWPHISLRIVEGYSRWLREWLIAGRIDAAVLYGVASSKALTVTPLLDESLYLIGRRSDYKKKWPSTIEMRKVRDFPLVLPSSEGSDSLRRIIDRGAATAGISLRPNVELEGITNLTRAVAAGLGATILPTVVVANELQAGTFVASLITNPGLSRSIVYARRSEKEQGLAHEKVFELLKYHMHRLVDEGDWQAHAPAAALPGD